MSNHNNKIYPERANGHLFKGRAYEQPIEDASNHGIVYVQSDYPDPSDPPMFISSGLYSRLPSVYDVPRNGRLPTPGYSRVPDPIYSTISEPDNDWYFQGLHYLANVHKVSISQRKGNCYTVCDMIRTVLYVVKIPMEHVCCGCKEPVGPGVNFKVSTSFHHPVLDIMTYEDRFCRRVPFVEGEVKVKPDVKLGVMEGDIDHVVMLSSVSGDALCSIELTDIGCCSCDGRVYEVIPTTARQEAGSIFCNDEQELILTFPSVFDVPRRALLLSCAISMQYQIEEDRRRSCNGRIFRILC
ncbi:uncharacterized protein LOC135220112 [Macrobrachium nipponense]|uniref:uncharacterized protein LOC135220112 n=1 Tax=Macrobrachium nipponense TaxID=159736 RepID=UPI0030C8B261